MSAPLIFLLEAAVVVMLPRQAVTGPLQLDRLRSLVPGRVLAMVALGELF